MSYGNQSKREPAVGATVNEDDGDAAPDDEDEDAAGILH